MNRSIRFGLALAMIAAMPIASIAQQHDRSGGSGGGRSGGSSAPAQAPAPARASAPAQPSAPARTAPSGGGFNLSHDIAQPAPVVHYAAPPVVQTQPVVRNAPPAAHYTAPVTHNAPAAYHGTTTNTGNAGNRGNQRSAPAHRAPSFTANVYGPYNGQFHGHQIHNAHYNKQAWGWNHGDAWQPASIYWGGGFWGAFALATLDELVAFGTYYDADNNVYYPSFELQSGSPGAEVLQDYGLTQTECGPPNLVVIWGPDNSVICTYPNDAVSPGNYQLDPSTLTLVSQ